MLNLLALRLTFFHKLSLKVIISVSVCHSKLVCLVASYWNYVFTGTFAVKIFTCRCILIFFRTFKLYFSAFLGFYHISNKAYYVFEPFLVFQGLYLFTMGKTFFV